MCLKYKASAGQRRSFGTSTFGSLVALFSKKKLAEAFDVLYILHIAEDLPIEACGGSASGSRLRCEHRESLREGNSGHSP